MTYELRQFKLTNGDEILCEVVQWHNEEELELVVKKAMKLQYGNNKEGDVRYYAFRPWMVYGESPDELVILNGNHVVGICEPSAPLVHQWKEAVEDMSSLHEERMKEHHETVGSNKSSKSSMNDKMKEFLQQATEAEKQVLQEIENSADSDGDNVLMFDPSKRTLH
jgi:hypothetical protein